MIEERFIRRLNVNGESRRQEYLNLGTAVEYKQSENCNTMIGKKSITRDPTYIA